MFNSKKDEKKKDSKVGKALTEFFERDKVKYVVNVLRWILFAFILTIVWDFRHYPLTMFLFIVLGILVTPTFNNFLKKKRIEISVKKKLLLFFIIAVIAILTAPIDENGLLSKGIEGVDYKNNGSGDVVLNNADLPVVSYAVNYYYDNVLTSSERYEANLYDVITFYEDKSQDGKYDLVTENNFPLEINSDNLKDNIINIYYRTHKDDDDVSSVSRNQTDSTDNKLFVTEDELQEGDVILEENTTAAEWSEQVITSKTYEEVQDMLGKSVDEGTKNVVYTVEYVYDGEIDDSLTDYYVLPKGSIINDAPMKDKEGFVYKTTENVPLTVDNNKEIVKVIYDKDAGEATTESTTEDSTEDSTEATSEASDSSSSEASNN